MSAKKWAVLFSLFVIIIALMGLLGYFPGLRFLGSFGRGYIPMAPTTSVSFIGCSLAMLLLFNQYRLSLITKIFSGFLIFVITIFGLLTLLEFLLNKELNFEGTFVPISGTLNGIPIARMSPATGSLFLLAGFIILLNISPKIKGASKKMIDYFRGGLNILLFSAAFVFFLAYVYGTPLLYKTNSTIPMALTTSLGFIFLSSSTIFYSEELFPVRVFTKNTTRSYLLRYIFPLVVLSTIVSGITVYLSVQLHRINPVFISIVFTIIVVVVAGFLASIISRHLSIVIENQKKDIEKSQRALKRSEEKFRTLFETMAQGVVYQNEKGEIISANPAAEHILGLSLDQMLGRTSIDPRWKAVDTDKNELAGEKHPAMMALSTGQKITNFVQGIFNPKINEYVWILVNSIPQFFNGEETPSQVYSTFLDITEARKAEMELHELKNRLEQQVKEKTSELNDRIAELEHFHEVTIERELRMEELRREIEELKNS